MHAVFVDANETLARVTEKLVRNETLGSSSIATQAYGLRNYRPYSRMRTLRLSITHICRRKLQSPAKI
jgi:hypothetical protein